VKIHLEFISIGVKIIQNQKITFPNSIKEPEIYSFCDECCKLQEKEYRGGIMITPNSISICKWSKSVLGLKNPETNFEKGLFPKLKYPVNGV
jgi:hypothetical protein